MKNGGDDGARTRDLRRDRKTVLDDSRVHLDTHQQHTAGARAPILGRYSTCTVVRLAISGDVSQRSGLVRYMKAPVCGGLGDTPPDTPEHFRTAIKHAVEQLFPWYGRALQNFYSAVRFRPSPPLTTRPLMKPS